MFTLISFSLCLVAAHGFVIPDEDIPEPPSLSPTIYDSLPPDLIALVSTDIPADMSRVYGEPDVEISKEIEEPIRGGRTYGMELKDDHGYVWNNVMPGPGVHYEIEGSESIEPGRDEEQPLGIDTETPKDDEVVEDDEVIEKEPETRADVIEPLDVNEPQDEKEPLEDQELKDDKIEDEAVAENVEDEQTVTDSTEIASDEKPLDLINSTEEKTEDNPDDLNTSSEEPASVLDLLKRRHKDDKQAYNQILDELLNDDQLWKWFSDWVTLHEVLKEEKIKDLVQEEVTKELQKIENPVKAEDEKKAEIIEDKDEKDETNKIQAHNLYGSSIGSEKVTNIFIFYPKQDADEIINKLDKDIDPNAIIHSITEVDAKDQIKEDEKDSVEKESMTADVDEQTNSPIVEIPNANENEFLSIIPDDVTQGSIESEEPKPLDAQLPSNEDGLAGNINQEIVDDKEIPAFDVVYSA